MAEVIPFPGCKVPPHAPPLPSLPPALLPAWQAEHMPLVDAALNLLASDDVEFRRRCKAISDADGPGWLADLSIRLDQLGNHVADVVSALTMTASRIRSTMATLPA